MRTHLYARNGQSALVVVAAVIFISTTVGCRAHRRIEDIANARADRKLAARLSGSFEYRPRSHVRGSTNHDDSDWQLLALVAKTRDASSGPPSVANLCEVGAGQLLAGRAEHAIASLEEAIRQETSEEEPARGIGKSKNAELLTDLSAAYYTDATENGHSYALVAAIECAERAATIEASANAPLWNRALTLQALGDAQGAAAAWQEYLRRDSDSGWAIEARTRLAETRTVRDEDAWPAAAAVLRTAAPDHEMHASRIVSRFPIRSVSLVEKEILPAWGRALKAGNALAAAKDLADAERIAGSIAEILHDPLLCEITSDARPSVAALFEAYGNLGSIFAQGGTAAVTAELERIRDEAIRLRSPAGLRFTLALARSRYEARAHDQALAELATIEGRLLERYPVSRAQFYWYSGLAEASLGYAADALSSYERGATIYRSFGDRGSAASLELMRADAAEYAGDIEEAWRSYMAGLSDIDRHGDAIMFDNAMFALARSALRRGYPHAALLLQTQSVERLRRTTRTAYSCQAFIARCETHARLGEALAARDDCRLAKTTFDSIKDATTRDRLEADLDVAVAASDASTSGSVGPLTHAIMVAVRGDDHFRLTNLYLARGRAFARANEATASEDDFRHAEAEIESQRAKLTSDQFRVTWLDTWRAVHDELVTSLLRQGRIESAFEVADRARARVAADRLAPGREGVTIQDVRQRLTPDTAFIELWTSSNDDAVAWVITRARTTCRRFKVRGVMRRLRECLDAFEAPDGSPPSDATPIALSDEIVRPWIADVQSMTTLLIAPAPVLASAPFPALYDQIANVPLVKRYTVVVEPSATVYALGKSTPLTGWKSALLVTAVGKSQPKLTTSREASALSRFGFSTVSRIDDATPGHFLENASRFDLVHYAGHAVETGDHESALVLLADDGHPEGLLRSTEIATGPRRDGGLIVLAACRTLRGRVSSEGTMSLAHAFLITGSSAVIGSLWNVDDEATDLLFSIFYRQLAAHRTPAEALRVAQLELATIHSDPRYWAGFQIYGGGSLR